MSYIDTLLEAAPHNGARHGCSFLFSRSARCFPESHVARAREVCGPEPVIVPQVPTPVRTDEGAVVAAIAIAMKRYLNDKNK
jgi:hypothetical protein